MRIKATSLWGTRIRSGAVALLIAACASSTQAQTVDSTKTPPVKKDSTTKAVPRPTPQFRSAIVPALRPPPITPKRAFLYSLAIPGLGQSRLDRGTAGAFFAAIELGSWAMVRKSSTDLRLSRRYSQDSLANSYSVGIDGKVVKVGTFTSEFPTELINTRRLHREDWLASLLFNHLISGADAFVAAQLWDINRTVAVKPYRDGAALVATIHW